MCVTLEKMAKQPESMIIENQIGVQPILRWPRINQRHKKYPSFEKSNCSQTSGKPNEVRGTEQVMCDDI